MAGEKIIGGISSKKIRRGLRGGYNLLVTDMRILGTKKSLSFDIDKLPSTPISTFQLKRALGRTVEEVLEELERKKDLEVRKDDLVCMKLKRPSPLGFGGKVEIVSGSKSYRLNVKSRKEFDRLRGLLAKFDYSKVKFEE